MVVGIVAANNIRYSPYIFYYTNILDELGIEYELIYANQNQLVEKFNKTSYPIEWDKNCLRSLEYYKFSRKVISIINRRRYDGLIMLTAITATYCSCFLKRNYTNRYIVDIRDYSHENIWLYNYLEKKAILSSSITVISSPMFKQFLPKFNYLICHNINFEVNSHKIWRKPSKNKIVIGYVGSLTYKENCVALIKLIDDDDRFEFKIYGFEPGEHRVERLVKSLNNSRIIYYGPYTPDEKGKIIDSVDILFNTYGNGCDLLDTALSNKLYDAFYYKKLLLTSPDTAMAQIGGDIAYSIDYKFVNSLDDLYQWVIEKNVTDVQQFQDTMFMKFFNENMKTTKCVSDEILKWR